MYLSGFFPENKIKIFVALLYGELKASIFRIYGSNKVHVTC